MRKKEDGKGRERNERKGERSEGENIGTGEGGG